MTRKALPRGVSSLKPGSSGGVVHRIKGGRIFPAEDLRRARAGGVVHENKGGRTFLAEDLYAARALRGGNTLGCLRKGQRGASASEREGAHGDGPASTGRCHDEDSGTTKRH